MKFTRCNGIYNTKDCYCKTLIKMLPQTCIYTLKLDENWSPMWILHWVISYVLRTVLSKSTFEQLYEFPDIVKISYVRS